MAERKPEQRLWDKFKVGTQDHGHWTRLENWVQSGVPDVNGYVDYEDLWIELKVVQTGNVVKIRPLQVSWHISRSVEGGISFILIEKANVLYLFLGRHAPALIKQGLADCKDKALALYETPYDWKVLIEMMLGEVYTLKTGKRA